MAEAARVTSHGSGILNKGEYGYPSGHLGHLTPEQIKSLEEFQQLCLEQGLYKTPAGSNAASHDDQTLLRFLRARRFVPRDALLQFKDTEAWRELNEINSLYDNIDIEAFDETRRLYPQWTGRRDKRGIPLFVFEVAPLNAKAMAVYAKSSEKTAITNSKEKSKKEKSQVDKDTVPKRLLRLFALYESLIQFTLPLCTMLKDRPHPDTPITQSNNIVDISGVGLKQFWNLRSHMQDASVLATAHYPETLDRIFIVGAPAFFPTVWSWIKRWFDPITVSKIFILSESMAYKTLSQFIDPADIPKKYGGELHFEFGMRPILDGAELSHIHWVDTSDKPIHEKWPIGPIRWRMREDGNMDMVAMGSVDGKERREVVAVLKLDDLNKSHAEEARAAFEAAAVEENVVENVVDKEPETIDPESEKVLKIATEVKLPDEANTTEAVKA